MRINLYGGPGSGKSTTAAWIFSQMKLRGYSVELVSEYVKAWAISKREVVGFDQLYLMGKQCNYEYRFLSNGIKNIVTDSPLLLSACYTRAYYPKLDVVADHMEGIIKEYDRQEPSLNIFLERGSKKYVEEGRYQTFEEATRLDRVIEETLIRLEMPYAKLPYQCQDTILDYITHYIKP